jgi:hypothetical protein
MWEIIQYLIYVCVFTISVFVFDRLVEDDATYWVAWLLQSLVLTGNAFFISVECRQISFEHKSDIIERAATSEKTILERLFVVAVWHFIKDIWNFNDFVFISLTTAGTIVRIANRNETNTSRMILAVAAISVWFKLLYYLRAFESPGRLGKSNISVIIYSCTYYCYFIIVIFLAVSMILRLAVDIRYFLLVLGIIITGFSSAIWLLTYPNFAGPFGTIRKGFLSSFLFMLGSHDADMSDTVAPGLATFLLVVS